ncbi:NitT/TauT family transport system ATP-binding protein [Sporobacter termitidis DSM 10068]|uniref:NitT/TauT family transport system ATP-binding protein n=1 Tax=Sporobacter termitidis DSM 10068 TaxID=1123282 RepID=A0A1M5XFY3_9FIRM|nr:ABC transporter ATP-binding protein [Sporobacter termitidis]SHH98424.1 NitT/TauT family transport system ATP-binding protein [Sporobacter termitidis DSM 10068]
MAKIEIKNLSRTYGKKGSKTEKFYALRDFNLSIDQGEFVTIVGPSGCGKSTLLDLLIGLSRPETGQILIDDKPVEGPALDRGIVLQGYALFPWRTVRKNVELGLEIKGVPRKERREISDHYIKLVDLAGFENHYPYELSGGMQQRAAIARILAYDPDVLLMDEPFAAVDAQTREVMQDELLSIWEKTGKTVLFVTHNIEEAVGLADKVAVLSRSPGAVKEVIDIDLPRPRRIGSVRNTPDFNLLYHRVWELLQDNREPAGAAARLPAESVADKIMPDAVL